jgi:hypothetical protein
MAEESKSSVSNLKAMFEQNIQSQAAQPKPVPKKLAPTGAFAAPTTAPAGAPPKTTAPSSTPT